METNEALQWFLFALFGLLILFLVIRIAVHSAMSEHNKQARHRTRMLIKQMRKQGFAREEIVDALNDDEATFWNKLD